jgi:hypothetical protein
LKSNLLWTAVTRGKVSAVFMRLLKVRANPQRKLICDWSPCRAKVVEAVRVLRVNA